MRFLSFFFVLVLLTVLVSAQHLSSKVSHENVEMAKEREMAIREDHSSEIRNMQFHDLSEVPIPESVLARTKDLYGGHRPKHENGNFKSNAEMRSADNERHDMEVQKDLNDAHDAANGKWTVQHEQRMKEQEIKAAEEREAQRIARLPEEMKPNEELGGLSVAEVLATDGYKNNGYQVSSGIFPKDVPTLKRFYLKKAEYEMSNYNSRRVHNVNERQKSEYEERQEVASRADSLLNEEIRRTLNGKVHESEQATSKALKEHPEQATQIEATRLARLPSQFKPRAELSGLSISEVLGGRLFQQNNYKIQDVAGLMKFYDRAVDTYIKGSVKWYVEQYLATPQQKSAEAHRLLQEDVQKALKAKRAAGFDSAEGEEEIPFKLPHHFNEKRKQRRTVVVEVEIE